MADNHNHTPLGAILTITSWISVTLTITLQDLDVYLKIVASIVAIFTGLMGGINWYWSIKKNKKIAKKDIPF